MFNRSFTFAVQINHCFSIALFTHEIQIVCFSNIISDGCITITKFTSCHFFLVIYFNIQMSVIKDMLK